MLALDCQRQAGGIALLWGNNNEASLCTYTNSHIDMIITVQGWSKFRLTGIYGKPDRARRGSTWNLIRDLSTQSNMPWCIIGNMNNVLGQAHKRGGRLYPSWLVQGFQEVLDDCGLIDMELNGYPFTCERGKGTEKWVEIRLDRAIVSKAWLEIFQDAKLTNLEVSTSDHTPILLEPITLHITPRKRRLKFENAWLREPICKQIVEDTWNKHQVEPLQNKLNHCLEVLTDWGQDITGNFRRRISDCKKVIRSTKG
ncbi:uncharacterized protein LOC141715199 [Apium graveolens]|uniref:uncharacterized protein LOC141715199 n=1 Tax=Apium graveolens TaxID=4045 RepID=UPI003D7954CF